MKDHTILKLTIAPTVSQTMYQPVASWPMGQGGTALVLPPPKFQSVKNFFLSYNFRSKIQNFWLKISNLGEFMDKIKIMSTHISSVGNLQLSVGKLQPPAPNVFNPRDH